MTGFTIRPATPADVETICAHRRSMFFDMGHRDDALLDEMIAVFRPWLRRMMSSGEYLAWVAVSLDGTIAAGLGLWLMDWPPHLIGAGARRANILNVYTASPFRRLGLARQLVKIALGWCQENGIRLAILHASEEGRPLYENFGFSPTNEMRLVLD